MRVMIYKLRREKPGRTLWGRKSDLDSRSQEDEWVIDEKHPVAVVTVRDGEGSFRFYDKSYETVIRRLFTGPAGAFVSGGRSADGTYFDAFVTCPAWTREAVDLIVGDKLRGYTLGGKIIDD